ncbi:MAG: hypothetical protein AAF847_17205 [Bacteroidota bacterium]
MEKKLQALITAIKPQPQTVIEDAGIETSSYASRLLNLKSNQLERFARLINFLLKDYEIVLRKDGEEIVIGGQKEAAENEETAE